MATLQTLLKQITIHENCMEFSPAIQSTVMSDSLSPSGVNDFAAGCVSKKLIERMLQKADGAVLDIMSPAYIGTATHAVLEMLMQLKPNERVQSQLYPIYTYLVSHHKITEPDNADDLSSFRESVLSLAKGLFDLEDPRAVKVFGTETFFETELWGVPMRGVVDRIDELSDGTLAVVDYKTGKYRAPNPRFGDNYTPQLVIYAMAIEQMSGRTVSLAYDAFVGANKTHEVKLDENQKLKIKNLVLEAWSTIEDVQDTHIATYKPSALCAWCPLAAHCPEAIKKGIQPVTVNGKTIENYSIPSDFQFSPPKAETGTEPEAFVYTEGKQWVPVLEDGRINNASAHSRAINQTVQESFRMLRYALPGATTKQVHAFAEVLVYTVSRIANNGVQGKVGIGHDRWMQAFWALKSWSYQNPVDVLDTRSWSDKAVLELTELFQLSSEILGDFLDSCTNP